MKAAWFVQWIVCAVILLSSCKGIDPQTTATTATTPTNTPTTTPASGVNSVPTEISLILKPSLAIPETTGVEFLIDNSNSIKQDCGEFDGRRFDFINYMLDILRTIPEPLSPNLYIGVSSFGNEDNNFTSLVLTQTSSPSFPPLDNKLTITGGYQNYSNAIQQAIDDINEQPVLKKYLIILTDGGFWMERPDDVLRKLDNITENTATTVLVGLICPEAISLQDDIAEWQTKINGTNGSVYVFNSVEDTGKKLLDNLKPFFPYSLTVSSANYLDPITIPGVYIKSYFGYWNKDKNSHLRVTDGTTGNFWDATPAQQPYSLQPISGCLQHSLLVPNPGDHWLLFIQARTFEDLKLIMSTDTEQLLEIVNNQSRVFNLQIKDETLPEYDLQNWKDCFLVDIGGANGVSIATPYDSFNFMQGVGFDTIQGQAQWFPLPFLKPEPIEIKIRLKSKNSNSPAWEVGYSLPIKFEAVFSPPTQTSLTNNNNPDASEKILTFANVASQPRIFLVSDLSYSELIDLGNKDLDKRAFQQIGFLIDGEASELLFSQPCHLSQEIPNQYNCIKYEQGLPLTFTYMLQTFKYIIEYYHFNRLFFIWKESMTTKEKAWECWINLNIINCDGNIPIPDIVPK